MPNEFDINQQAEDYEDDELVLEEHTRRGCKYLGVNRTPIIINGFTIYILVRVCKCRWYKSKGHFLKYRNVKFFKDVVDGVELHVDTRCRYKRIRMPNGRVRLQQICYCPRDLYDQLGIE